MTPTIFLEGILAPLYALFEDGFNPAGNFGQFCLIAIVALSAVSVMINFIKV